MKRKLLIIGIALIGMAIAFGSNAWAGQDRGGKQHKKDRNYHQSYKTPAGNHYGWDKGKGNPHNDIYQHRPEYRDRYRDDRWNRDRHYRDRYRKYNHKVVEKHVYHHCSSDDRYDDDGFNVAVSVIDQFLSVAVAVSGTR